ncbi:hypothetical protein [Streptomyces halobius]|uniref:Uncharacterized protein n=1 Tax=Streptomyces halobius TaxID=2879846 RepID=A0ABY4M1R9_9ACTN|nr:hypothetical protein [Streptomyces halobius]UQA91665.1 hypothetical protein K9S39_07120 [Streptomyces halobius]
MLHKAGVPLSEFQKPGREGINADDLLYRLHMAEVLTYEGRAIALLRVAQNRQDAGVSWGQAVREAVTSVESAPGPREA